MDAQPVCVPDTSVLLNLATPVVDRREQAPSGPDPLKTVLSTYDVHVPATVLGELTETATGDDLLGAAATLVLRAGQHLTDHDVAEHVGDPLDTGLDPGETRAIRLANELGAPLFVTDEFGSTNYLLVALALEDRETLFTTPHLLAGLGAAGVLQVPVVEALLSYYVETKGWDRAYVDLLRREVLREGS